MHRNGKCSIHLYQEASKNHIKKFSALIKNIAFILLL